MANELPEMIPVESSQISQYGYIPSSQTLFIHFANGSVYSYAHVPGNLVKELSQADSVGSFFHKNIKTKPEAYPFTKVSG